MKSATDAPSRSTPQGPAFARRWRTHLARLVCVLASLVLCLAGGEVALRLAGARPQTATVLSTFFQYDRATGWSGRPLAAGRFTTTNFDVQISHDGDGLRQAGLTEGIASDTGSAVPVTWFLGDSGTWGWGVADGETYVDHLNRLARGQQRYRNLGMCGFSSVQQAKLLEKQFAEGHRPARVVVLFCNNDLRENVDSYDQRPPRPYLDVQGDVATLCNYPVAPARGWNAKAWLVVHSRAFNWLNYAVKSAQLRWKHQRSSSNTGTSLNTNLDAATTETSVAACPADERLALATVYSQIKALCDQQGVWLGVATEISPPGVLAEVCDELGIPLVDLAPRWQSHTHSTNPVPTSFPTDPHYNARGHELLARALFEQLGPATRSLRLADRPRDAAASE